MKLLQTPYRTVDFQTVRHCHAYFKHSGGQTRRFRDGVASLPYERPIDRIEPHVVSSAPGHGPGGDGRDLLSVTFSKTMPFRCDRASGVEDSGFSVKIHLLSDALDSWRGRSQPLYRQYCS